MQAIIMAGGQGRRMRESGSSVPKPLTPVAGQPMIVHQARHLQRHGFDRIVVALGHRAESVERGVLIIKAKQPELQLYCHDTGIDTGNAGRLLHLRESLQESHFLMCWCDVISDLDLGAMLDFHRAHGRLATVATTREPARFGVLQLQGDRIVNFREKDPGEQRWINAGFTLLESQAMDRIADASESWERITLPGLIADDQVRAFRHEGYWQAVDSLADRDRVEYDFREGRCPWLSP